MTKIYKQNLSHFSFLSVWLLTYIYMVIIFPESLVLSLSMNGLCTVLTASEHAELFCDVILPLTFRTFRGFFPPWLKFLYILRTSFWTSYKTGLEKICSLGFWLSDNVFISTKFPKNSLLGIRLLVDNFPFLLQCCEDIIPLSPGL